MKSVSSLKHRLTRKHRIRKATERFWDPATTASGSIWADGLVGLVMGLVLFMYIISAGQ